MGFHGAGLYDDDTAADVRGAYREYIGDGVEPERATDRLLEEWADALGDSDASTAFWLALADTQWRLGRLEERVRLRAFVILEDGSDLERFAHDPRLLAGRRVVLDELAARLAAPAPAPRRIRQVFRSRSPVALGDVFSYELAEGSNVYFRTVAVTGDDRDSYPTVEPLDVAGPLEAAEAVRALARPPLQAPGGQRPELLCLIRDRRDPDPAERIRVIARGTSVTRRRTVPATMVRWVELGETLRRQFGLA